MSKAYDKHITKMNALLVRIRVAEDGPHKKDMMREWRQMEKDRKQYVAFMRERKKEQTE